MSIVFVFLHVFLAILIFGGLITMYVVGLVFGAREKEVSLPLLRAMHRTEEILGPATIIVPLLGIGLVFQSNDLYEMGQAWVILSIVLYVIAAALGPGLAAKQSAAAIAKLEAAPAGTRGDAVAAQELAMLRTTFLVMTALLTVIVLMMVWRPGSDFNVSTYLG